MLSKPQYRIALGSIGFIVGLIIFAFSGFESYNPEPTIGVSMIGFSSALLSVGIFKKNQGNG